MFGLMTMIAIPSIFVLMLITYLVVALIKSSKDDSYHPPMVGDNTGKYSFWDTGLTNHFDIR